MSLKRCHGTCPICREVVIGFVRIQLATLEKSVRLEVLKQLTEEQK